jgi:hypothetical protein
LSVDAGGDLPGDQAPRQNFHSPTFTFALLPLPETLSWSLPEDIEEIEADEAGAEDLPPVDEGSAGAGRMEMPEVRVA